MTLYLFDLDFYQPTSTLEHALLFLEIYGKWTSTCLSVNNVKIEMLVLSMNSDVMNNIFREYYWDNMHPKAWDVWEVLLYTIIPSPQGLHA